MTKKLLLASLALLLFIPGFLFSQTLEDKAAEKAKWQAIREIYKDLNENQKETITTLKEETAKKSEVLKTDMEIARLELKKLLMKENVTKGEIRQQLEKIMAITIDLKMLQYSLEIDIKAALTEEQVEKYEKLRIKIARKIEKERTERQKEKRQKQDESKSEKRERGR